jgi:lipopolysaccharide transport system permease protein
MQTTWIDLRSQYAGSAFGLAWIVFGPLFLLVLYAGVYGVIFRIRPERMTFAEYILYVLVGLVSFMAFTSSMTFGSTSFVRNKQLLLNTIYPPELIPIRTVLVQSLPIAIGLGATIVAAAIFASVSWTILLVPFVFLMQVLFTSGLVLMLALVTLAIRDIQHVLQYLSFVLLIVTPIGYSRDLIPSALRWPMHFNPLFYFVTAYQDLIVFRQLPEASVIVIGTLGSVVSFVGAYALFRRAKQVFFDYA